MKKTLFSFFLLLHFSGQIFAALASLPITTASPQEGSYTTPQVVTLTSQGGKNY